MSANVRAPPPPPPPHWIACTTDCYIIDVSNTLFILGLKYLWLYIISMDMHILNHDLLPFPIFWFLALHDRGNSRYLDDVFCVARQKINSSDKSNQLQICKLRGLTVIGIWLFISLCESLFMFETYSIMYNFGQQRFFSGEVSYSY